MGTMFWGEGCHRGVTVGGWGVIMGGWSVCHSGRLGCHSKRLGCHSGSGSHSLRYHSEGDRRHGWNNDCHSGGVVHHSGWSLVGWADPTTHVTPGKHGPEIGPRKPGADPPLVAATLD